MFGQYAILFSFIHLNYQYKRRHQGQIKFIQFRIIVITETIEINIYSQISYLVCPTLQAVTLYNHVRWMSGVIGQ